MQHCEGTAVVKCGVAMFFFARCAFKCLCIWIGVKPLSDFSWMKSSSTGCKRGAAAAL